MDIERAVTAAAEAIMRVADQQVSAPRVRYRRGDKDHKNGGCFHDQARAAIIAALPFLGAQEWQDISTAHPNREVWLFTPGLRLGADAADDIRFECPSNWTWATMWMPAQIPAPPVAVIAEERTDG